MVRVFFSRCDPDLEPGEGDRISWNTGEEVRVVSGRDEGRIFVVLTEGRKHADLPYGYVREGYFTDDPERTRWAMPEKTLWFKEQT